MARAVIRREIQEARKYRSYRRNGRMASMGWEAYG